MRVTTPAWDASRWVKCPASALMRAKYPQGRTFEKNEGSAAHRVAETMLLGGTVAEGSEVEGITVTRDILDNVGLYVEAICDVVGDTLPAPLNEWVSEVEGNLDFSHIHPEQHSGRADYWCREQFDGRALHVWDLKYGRAIVDAFENWQLIMAASSIIERHKPNIPEEFPVYLHIFQPRAYKQHSVWSTSYSELTPYFGLLSPAAHEARGPNPFYVTGGHCRYCNGLPYCPGARDAAVAAFEFSGYVMPEDLQENPDAMAVERAILTRAFETLKFRLDSVNDYLLAKMLGGAVINGLGVSHTRGSRVWSVDPEAIIMAGSFEGVDLSKPREVVTPVQAVKAGLPESVVNALSYRQAGSAKIVEEDPDLAKKIFGGK